MSGPVEFERRGRVALVRLVHLPANRLDHALREGLMEALEAIEDDPGIAAVVLCGAGAGFSAGMDPDEIEGPQEGPTLSLICDRMERLPRPAIAALHGDVLGAGFELALAADWRLARAGSRLGLPDIALGLPPVAGGAARLPRIVGARVALDLLLGGRPISAEEAATAGLVDGVFGKDPVAAALSLAEDIADRSVGLRPSRARSEGLEDPPGYLAEVASRRRALAASPVPAVGRILDCVEAALLLPFEQALALGEDAYAACHDTAESRALRHAALAERRAALMPVPLVAPPRALDRVAVIGGGRLGAAIALALLDAGLKVALCVSGEADRKAAIAWIEAQYVRALEVNRLDEETLGARIAALEAVTEIAELGDIDSAIEATEDEADARSATLVALEAALPAGGVIATTSAELGLEALGPGMARPERLVGLHFFAPVGEARLLEVVAGPRTVPEAVATAFALAHRLGKVAVRAGDGEGLIGSRVSWAGLTAAELVLEAGAEIEEIDAAIRGAGFRKGPFELQDIAGLDVALAGRERLARDREPSAFGAALAELLRAAGRLGLKAGRGYYAYDEGGGAPRQDPEVAALLAEIDSPSGIEPRSFTPDEIRRRVFAAMANEGARLLADGAVSRASDIDLLMLLGFGFPRHLGGPMQWADETGLLLLRDDLRAWAEEIPGVWTPVDLWDELIKAGRGFGSVGS